jgi:hypothetical protein
MNERMGERMAERFAERSSQRVAQKLALKVAEKTAEKLILLPAYRGAMLTPRKEEPTRRFATPRTRSVRSMYADILSVGKSEVLYGKGTSASLVKHPELWKHEGGRVPTAEMLSGKKRRFSL